MPTPAKSAHGRAQEFLRDGGEFHLGRLVTEAAHPRSRELSQVAGNDAAAGLALLFDVDRDVVEAYDRWSRSGQPEDLRDLALASLEGGGRLFFTGCGATGRLSIQLDSIWRGFWRDRREQGQASPPPDEWEDRTVSVMAGGDYALIKSVEGFEDFAPFGRKQIADLGVSTGDVVFAITEGGETSFARSSSEPPGRDSRRARRWRSSTTTPTTCSATTSVGAERFSTNPGSAKSTSLPGRWPSPARHACRPRAFSSSPSSPFSR
jgi:N-acetylmuramic acid 6-phosphate etherase